MDVYIFADEAGNFDFSNNRGASRYFTLVTATMENCSVGDRLLALRRDMGWRSIHLDSVFHATDDPQVVRDEVFEMIAEVEFRIDATLLEKRKAQPHLHRDESLYKMAWYLHMKHVAPKIVNPDDRLFVVAAGLGTKRQRGRFYDAVYDVVSQVVRCRSYRVAFWPAVNDPCLQVADYCTWAIQRKWERGDTRSYDMIADKVASEKDIWSIGAKLYY